MPKSDFFQKCPQCLWGAPRGSGGVPVPLGVPPVPSWGPWGPIGPMEPLEPYRAHVGPFVGPCYAVGKHLCSLPMFTIPNVILHCKKHCEASLVTKSARWRFSRKVFC